jgi:hypothetical protein
VLTPMRIGRCFASRMVGESYQRNLIARALGR